MPTRNMLTLDDVEAFLAAVLERDAEALGRIRAAPDDTRMEDGRFVFSIAGLWTALDPEGETGLSGFRKLLYSSDLNRRLGAHGATILVYRNGGKVASNLYVLAPVHPAPPV